MKNGGKRPGAGRPRGSKSQKTLEKEEAKRVAREIILAELRPLLESQIANAKGIKYLVVRERKGGKFIRVTETMARARSGGMKPDEEAIEVWEKDPSVHAFAELMDRALDKAAQPVKGEPDAPIRLDIMWKASE